MAITSPKRVHSSGDVRTVAKLALFSNFARFLYCNGHFDHGPNVNISNPPNETTCGIPLRPAASNRSEVESQILSGTTVFIISKIVASSTPSNKPALTK